MSSYLCATVMNTAKIELKERVKELKCLYAISKVAAETSNNMDTLFTKTVAILPAAMQYPRLAEASITVSNLTVATNNFNKCKHLISVPLTIDNKKQGTITVGYISPTQKKLKLSFLSEERHLLKAVARELSLFIKRASAEEDKQKLQTQLQHVERLAFVGELSAGIAHELNEPLARILGFAQLIKKSGKLNDQQAEDVERIVKASLYTREIIKKLMIFSRQMPQQISTVNLNDIVNNILYFIDVRFQGRNIKITKQLYSNLPNIKADEVQVSQVLVNLITNAVHAMPSGGNIIVKTSRKKDYIALTVTDTGTGMTPEIKSKIFEPFFTTKLPGQGTGLGLSVVQGIIQTHNGKINVISTPGKGSQFEILLPIKRTSRKR